MFDIIYYLIKMVINSIKNLWKNTASDIQLLLQKKEVSPLEVLYSSIERINEINPLINAVVTIEEEQAIDNLKNIQHGDTDSVLKGMPILVKDINDVKGMKTTYGSQLFSNHIPKESDIIVETIVENGGNILGKTNIPEFAAGSHTYNKVFGTTKNPWNTEVSSGGSSGGSAAALASGMAWFATGSDLGGSLRNPASWCGVAGLRPTPGLVPHGPSKLPFLNLSVDGPMARNVEDLAIFLDAMVSHNNKDPLSFSKTPNSYHKELVSNNEKKHLIGFTDDFGIFPCDHEVRDMIKNTIKLFESLGHKVENVYPDMKNSEKSFQKIRAYMFYANYKFLLQKDQRLIKDEVIWNIQKGSKLTIDELVEAEEQRLKIYKNAIEFFEKFDFLVIPSSIVPAFSINEKWVKKVEDTVFDNYVSWLMIAACISLTGCPSLALPTSFSNNNAPIGIQIVAPPYQESKLLNFAKSVEDNINISSLIPINVNNETF